MFIVVVAAIIGLIGYFLNSATIQETGRKMQGMGCGCLKIVMWVIVAGLVLSTMCMCADHFH